MHCTVYERTVYVCACARVCVCACVRAYGVRVYLCACVSSSAALTMTRCWLEFDVDDQRGAWARACAFVEACDLRYGFSSKVLSELGGSEKARVGECYESDYEWGSKGPIRVTEPGANRVVIELFEADSPVACENFAALCSGSKGKSGTSGITLCYRGNRLHRVVRGFVAQGGDITFGNGSGGESIWGGKKFKDDKGGLKRKHDSRGIVSMGNSGKNSNSSQFFFCLGPAKACDGKHVVFGKVVEGMEVLDLIEAEAREPGSGDENPMREIVIVDCGVL